MMYSRSGQEIDATTWAALWETMDYRRVGLTKIPQTKKWVSTVWLGLDHTFGTNELPVIFETMVFNDKYVQGCYMRRYSTEEDAIAGHAETVRIYRLNYRKRRALRRKEEQ